MRVSDNEKKFLVRMVTGYNIIVLVVTLDSTSLKHYGYVTTTYRANGKTQIVIAKSF